MDFGLFKLMFETLPSVCPDLPPIEEGKKASPPTSPRSYQPRASDGMVQFRQTTLSSRILDRGVSLRSPSAERLPLVKRDVQPTVLSQLGWS